MVRQGVVVGSAIVLVLSSPVAPTQATGRGCGPEWSFVPSPNRGAATNILHGVASIGPGDAWAVGDVTPPNGRVKPLVLYWDGSAWAIVDTPDPRPSMDSFADVDFVAPHDGWAVGYTGDETSTDALVMHWDGTQWSRVATPQFVASTSLVGVSVLSSDDAWAVGAVSNQRGERTFVLHWDGVAWTRVPSPNVPGINRLEDVAALGSQDVWAVGDAFGPQYEETMAMHWDGTAWSIVPSPNVPGIDNLLWGIDGTAGGDVWAVGRTQSSLPPFHTFTLVLRWDGTAWIQVPSPSPSGFDGLEDVEALSGQDAWAVGNRRVSGLSGALALRWDGSAWESVPTPDLHRLNTLAAVDSTPDGETWAVGDALSHGQYVTFTEHVCP